MSRYIHEFAVAKARRRQHILAEYGDEFNEETRPQRSAIRPDIGNADHIDTQPEKEEVQDEQI